MHVSFDAAFWNAAHFFYAVQTKEAAVRQLSFGRIADYAGYDGIVCQPQADKRPKTYIVAAAMLKPVFAPEMDRFRPVQLI
jgi:hypothetical protein